MLLQAAKVPAPPPGTRITILAPSNDAFYALGADLLAELGDNLPVLREILLDHILMESVHTDDITGTQTYLNMNDREVVATNTGGTISFQAPLDGATAGVVIPDLEACAGTVQVIDQVRVVPAAMQS